MSDFPLPVDLCSCLKDPGTYGAHGWHWRVNPAHPEARQEDQAVERCRAYVAAVRETLDARRVSGVAESERKRRAGRRY